MNEMASSKSFNMIYCWGKSSFGQLGVGGTEVENSEALQTPSLLSYFNKNGLQVKTISCGWNHTVFLSGSGILYSCGSNDAGQLGHGKSFSKPERIDALEAITITQVSCGKMHTVVLNDKGQLYSFGSNSRGQLGLGSAEETPRKSPRSIKGFPQKIRIAQVACGGNHCLSLSSDGRVFAWGENTYGQVGVGAKNPNIATPYEVSSIASCPIYLVTAGGAHSFALTVSGTLFGWGKNEFGQLGLGDKEDRVLPTLVKMLRSQFTRYICCGEDHTVVLTKQGGVFTFGAGNNGQLGHSSTSNESNPKQVLELMGSKVTQIACGRYHTLAYVGRSGKLYSFGLATTGQLGSGSVVQSNVPVMVKGNWTCYEPKSSSEKNLTDEVNKNFKTNRRNSSSQRNNSDKDSKRDDYYICKIFSGGDHNFALAEHSQSGQEPFDMRSFHHSETVLFMTEPKVYAIAEDFKRGVDSPTISKHLEILETVFSSQSCVNSSFLQEKTHEQTNSRTHGVNMPMIRRCMSKLGPINILTNQMVSAIEKRLVPSLLPMPPDIEALRVYLVVPEIAFLLDDSSYLNRLMIPLGNRILSLKPEAEKVLGRWWASLPATFFTHIIQGFQSCVKDILGRPLPPYHNEELFARQGGLSTCMMVLEKLFKVNNEVDSIVSFNTFYIPEVQDHIDIRQDFLQWLHQTNVFSFCQYPFVFDSKAKAVLLQTDALFQMQTVMHEVHSYNFQAMVSGNFGPVNPFLVIHIRRDHLVDDTLNEVMRQSPQDLKKPLKIRETAVKITTTDKNVVFHGEEAVDAGGVRKEFFLLLMRDILNPKYGMFVVNEESQALWFNDQTFEGPEMFFLIGTICGLAIYNSTIIDVNFPPVLYKKLLGKSPNLDDFREVQPDVARNLQYLLDFPDEDVEETFCLYFQIVRSVYDQLQYIDLIPNGGETLVTSHNREKYVEAYIDHVLNKSVGKQFRAFSEGFLRVCGGRVLGFFHPQELMEMVVGCQEYDFNVLEKVTEYKGEYYRRHPVIINFWDVFYEFTLDMKKKFLAFLTGSSKVPMDGVESMQIIIQPVPGGERGDHLPVAHTCFNLLDLPRYPTKEIMRTKLTQAIEFYEGFGLV